MKSMIEFDFDGTIFNLLFVLIGSTNCDEIIKCSFYSITTCKSTFYSSSMDILIQQSDLYFRYKRLLQNAYLLLFQSLKMKLLILLKIYLPRFEPYFLLFFYGFNIWVCNDLCASFYQNYLLIAV